jgi:predicted dehydrogenase
MNVNQRVRYAIVGLGHIAQAAVLPAFAHASENSELRALVSGDPSKLDRLSKTYHVPHTFSYRQYEECLHSGEVDAVYIALPNGMHCEYSVAAARAGIHVLCEKPMAVTEADCERMLCEARQRQVRLMIANRLHFATPHREAVKIVTSGQLGIPRIFTSVLTFQIKEGDIRLDQALGGAGPLYDIGIYCISAARHLFGEEPIEVCACHATSDDRRFAEVEETTSAILGFPQGRIATFTCSFGAARESFYEVVGSKAILRADSAYDRSRAATHYLTSDGQTKERTFPQQDQFAEMLIEFSDCVLSGRDHPQACGEDGLADVRIIEALLCSAQTGQPVKLGPLAHARGSERVSES